MQIVDIWHSNISHFYQFTYVNIFFYTKVNTIFLQKQTLQNDFDFKPLNRTVIHTAMYIYI